MELSNAIVAELGIEHFFNIQLVGDYVIEINPRISTIVYQDDLNLPYLGVKRAIGEISDDELRALAPRIRPGPDGAALLRPARIRRVSPAVPTSPAADERATRMSPAGRCPARGDAVRGRTGDAPGHALPGQRRRDPVGERAGAAAQGGRRAARRLQPRQAPPRGRLVARAARRRCRGGSRRSSRALARLLPRTDVFHFYFGLTLVPPSLQFPILRAARQEERLPLPRLRHPRQDARPSSPYGKRADARDRRLLRRAPLGARGARRAARARPAARSRPCRRATTRGRSSSTRRRTARRRAPAYVIEACEQLAGRPRHRRGRPRTRRRASATPAPTSSSTS